MSKYALVTGASAGAVCGGCVRKDQGHFFPQGRRPAPARARNCCHAAASLAGIGLAIAKDLLAHGYTVFANGRNEERLAKAFADLPSPQRARVM
jgi:signal transduction histidine kinase